MAARMKAVPSALSALVSGHRTVRHLPLLLFLSGILAYGASFAWYMLANFDLFNMIRDANIDDSFYYFQIARNLADGKLSTFDGGITRTNGYHPVWMLLITPFHWILDPKAALFGIKVFEIMLVAGAVVLIVVAARLARLPWILLFAVLPVLYHHRPLISGMEAAAALFMLGLLFFALTLFARNPTRWRWLLAVVAFLLPWVRLEYAAISLAATAALYLVERPRRKRPSGGPWAWDALVRSISSLGNATVPLLGACAGILVYFAYNLFFFGGIVPVSGAIKLAWSQSAFTIEGYSLVQNFKDMLQYEFFDDELLVALEVLAYLLVIWYFSQRSPSWRCEERLRIIFLIGVFSLAAGHLAKFAQTVFMMHPGIISYTAWYYGPAYLMMALIVPVRCFVAIHFIHCFVGPKSPRMAGIAKSGILAIAAIFMVQKTDFTYPYRFVDFHRDYLAVGWKISAYAGSQLTNWILPGRSVGGSWNAGVVGYFSRFPVVNLDGLVNSYDYLQKSLGRGHISDTLTSNPKQIYSEDSVEFFHQTFGITHFFDYLEIAHLDNDSFAAEDFENVYFEAAPFGDLEIGYVPILWSKEPPRTSQNEIEHASWFWKRMRPHFDLETDGLGAVVDGRLVQVFTRECETAEGGSSLVLLFDGEGRLSGVSSPWENRWTTARGWRPGSCMDTILLPGDAGRPIRMEVVSEGGDISRLFGANRRVLRSGYDVYLRKKQLVYVNRQCDGDADTSPFFVHVTPIDDSDLPIGQRRYGIEHLDFAFDDFGHRMGDTCIAVRDLPEYDIARVRIGQYVPGGPVLWEGGIRLDVDAGWIAGVVERTEPVIRSGGFDVYHDGDRLLYTGAECGDENVAPPFFLHIFPEDEGDLPAGHREHGLHNLDFRFETRRLPLDFYFKDAPAPGGVGCAAVVDLPGYEVVRIRTGQYVPGEPWLWHGEFEVGGGKAP